MYQSFHLSDMEVAACHYDKIYYLIFIFTEKNLMKINQVTWLYTSQCSENNSKHIQTVKIFKWWFFRYLVGNISKCNGKNWVFICLPTKDLWLTDFYDKIKRIRQALSQHLQITTISIHWNNWFYYYYLFKRMCWKASSSTYDKYFN